MKSSGNNPNIGLLNPPCLFDDSKAILPEKDGFFNSQSYPAYLVGWGKANIGTQGGFWQMSKLQSTDNICLNCQWGSWRQNLECFDSCQNDPSKVSLIGYPRAEALGLIFPKPESSLGMNSWIHSGGWDKKSSMEIISTLWDVMRRKT